jgi:hypothetical protein
MIQCRVTSPLAISAKLILYYQQIWWPPPFGPKIAFHYAQDNLGVKEALAKSWPPRKSLEMPIIARIKKNYLPHLHNQRYFNSY